MLQPREHLGPILGRGERGVDLGDEQVGLSQRELRVVDEGAEEGPFAVRGTELVPARVTLARPGRERAAQAVPRGQVHAALGPGEDPGNRPQVFDAGSGPAARGPAAQVQEGDLVDGSGGVEIGNEGSALDERAIGRRGGGRDRGHEPVPRGRARGVGGLPGQARHEHGVDELLQVALREVAARVAVGDGLALLGEAEAPGHRFSGLGQDGAVGGPSAAAHGPAAAVEEQQSHVVAPAHLRERALRAVELPVRGDVAGVLVGIAVADHHRLAAADAARGGPRRPGS